ncbi:MAG TPA: hypothetical protein VGS97_03020, partial [Actinocrinis sp.]|uniref:hypothetical protein n=1 Tax=Actinocrinis sp. TaxID=1920516 RepID=UPI002DDCE1CB
MRSRSKVLCVATTLATLASSAGMAFAAPSAGANVRVTVDDGANGGYRSADQLAGGGYNDAVLAR